MTSGINKRIDIEMVKLVEQVIKQEEKRGNRIKFPSASRILAFRILAAGGLKE